MTGVIDDGGEANCPWSCRLPDVVQAVPGEQLPAGEELWPPEEP
jgi:hypothetical protein